MPRKTATAKSKATAGPSASPPTATSASAVPPPLPPPPADGGIDFASLDVGTGKLTGAQRRKLKRDRETTAQKKAAPESLVGHSRSHVQPGTLKDHIRVNKLWDEFGPYYLEYGELDDDDDDDASTTPKPARQPPPVLYDPELPENDGREPPARTPNSEELKHFALFLSRTVEGRRIINANGDKAGVPSIDTIRSYMRSFISLWERYFAKPVPTGDRNELYSYLDSTKFRDLSFITTLEVKKHDLSLDDIKTLVTILLANPQIVRTMHALLNAQLVTLLIRYLGGRIGEFVESARHLGSGHAPRYGYEIKFFAVPSVQGQLSEPLLAIQLVGPWLKNYRDDESAKKVLILVADPAFDPNFDPVGGSFNRAFDDAIFTHFESMDQLKSARIDKWTELTIKEEWRGKFFMRADVQRGHEVVTSLDIPYRYGHYIPIWRELCIRGGFELSVVPHNCRLASSGEVFRTCGQYEQIRMNYHKDPKSHARSYMTQTVTADLVSVTSGLAEREGFVKLVRFFDSATRTKLRTGVGPLSVSEKMQLVARQPAIRAQVEKLKALRDGAAPAEEHAKAVLDYKRMFSAASGAFREAKRKQGIAMQAHQDQRAMFAPESSSDSDDAQTSQDPPLVDFPNEYARVAYSPLNRTLEYPMERYVLLANAYLSTPRLTRLPLFSEGLIDITGAECPDCHTQLYGYLDSTLHAASCQAAGKLLEARDLLPDDEWQALVCPSCQRRPRIKNKDTVYNTREEFEDHVRAKHRRGRPPTCCFCEASGFASTQEWDFHVAQEHNFALDGGFAEYRHARKQWYARSFTGGVYVLIQSRLVAPNGVTEDIRLALQLERDERFPHCRREEAVQLDLAQVTPYDQTVAPISQRPIIVVDCLFSWGGTLPDYHERSSASALVHLATCLFCEADGTPGMLRKAMRQYTRKEQREHTWLAHLNHLSKDTKHVCPCTDCGAQEFAFDELISHLILVHLVALYGSVGADDKRGVPTVARALYISPAPSPTSPTAKIVPPPSSVPSLKPSPSDSDQLCHCAGCGSRVQLSVLDKHVLLAGPESLCAHRAAYRISNTKEWVAWQVPAHADTVVPRPLPGTEAYVCIAETKRKDLPVGVAKQPRCTTACVDLNDHNCKHPHATRYVTFKSGTREFAIHEAPTPRRQVARPVHACACGHVTFDIRVHLAEVKSSPEKFEKKGCPRYAHTHTEFFPSVDDQKAVSVDEWLVDAPVAPFLVRCAESDCRSVFAHWDDHANTKPASVTPSAIAQGLVKKMKSQSCAANQFYVLNEDAKWSDRVYTAGELQALDIPTSRMLRSAAIRWPDRSSPSPTPSSPLTSAPSSPRAPMSPMLLDTSTSALPPAPTTSTPPALTLDGHSPVNHAWPPAGSLLEGATPLGFLVSEDWGGAQRDAPNSLAGSSLLRLESPPRVRFDLPGQLGDIPPDVQRDNNAYTDLLGAAESPWTPFDGSPIQPTRSYGNDTGLLTPVTPSMTTSWDGTLGAFRSSNGLDGGLGVDIFGVGTFDRGLDGGFAGSSSSGHAGATYGGGLDALSTGMLTPATPSTSFPAWGSSSTSATRDTPDDGWGEEGGPSWKRPRFE